MDSEGILACDGIHWRTRAFGETDVPGIMRIDDEGNLVNSTSEGDVGMDAALTGDSPEGGEQTGDPESNAARDIQNNSTLDGLKVWVREDLFVKNFQGTIHGSGPPIESVKLRTTVDMDTLGFLERM